MDARTLEALKASIAKWEKNAEANSPDHALVGAQDCPLCRLFLTGKENSCEGCPVKEATGVMGCSCTPFDEADEAYLRWHEDDPGAGAEFREAARDEVDFLKSLLPTEPQP